MLTFSEDAFSQRDTLLEAASFPFWSNAQLFQFGDIFGCLLAETYFWLPQTTKFSDSPAFHIFGSLSFSCSRDIYGGGSKLLLRRLHQPWFPP